jgi:lipopolysaccharide export LptBFGC system permease protein LptF
MQLTSTEWALLAPIIVIELALMVFALVDLIRRKKVKGTSKLVWGIIIVVFGVIGSIIYFVAGRAEE